VGIEKRLARLEGRARPAALRRSEEERYTYWLQRQRIRRRDATPKCAFHARSMIGWLRIVGKLPGMPAAEIVRRIMDYPHDSSGYMQPPETRSRSVVTWEVMRSVWREEEGLEGGDLPDTWRESFEAGEILRGVYREAPAEELARWILEAVEAEEERGADANEEINRLTKRHLERLNMDPELLDQAAGPDAGEIPPQERHWRLSELSAEDLDGPMGWEIRQALIRLANERRRTLGGNDG